MRVLCPLPRPLSVGRGASTSALRHTPYCSTSRRRRNIGVPKSISLSPDIQPHPDSVPWDDYLLPILPGNSTPQHPELFLPPHDFTVLGIESSCDDTAAALVCSDGTVLREETVSQTSLVAEWGGVVPHIARDAHAAAIDGVVARVMDDQSWGSIDAVAVTMGPGLEVCLRVGYRKAREIARREHKEFVAVNHLEAHILVARLGTNTPEFPFLCLLMSGGHCQLLVARGVGRYEVLGGTLDDAMGEAFDKTARMLAIDGGGAGLERVAREEGQTGRVKFGVPMRKRADCNFSFAGLKTKMRAATEALGEQEVRRRRGDLAAGFQDAATRHVEERVRRAIKTCEQREVDGKTLVVCGGVAANMVVRDRLKQVCADNDWDLVVPDASLCRDNAVMVAWTAVERLRNGVADCYDRLDVRARWPLGGADALVGGMPGERRGGRKKMVRTELAKEMGAEES